MLIPVFNVPNKRLAILNEEQLLLTKLSCSELTYKEIADKMGISEKNLDRIRAKIFEILEVKSRPALVMYAVKSGLAATA